MSGIPLMRILRAKKGTTEMEIVPGASGLTARLKGLAGRAALAEIRSYVSYLLALRPKLLTIDLSGLIFVAAPVRDLLEDFARALVRAGGGVEFTGMQPLVLECFTHWDRSGAFPRSMSRVS